MKNLLTALATKISGSDLSTDVGGRIYLDEYPLDEAPPTFPYIIYSIVSGVPNKTFTEIYTDTSIQFSLFSSSSSADEITTMYANLKALLDEGDLTITGSSLVWMREETLSTRVDNITTGDGTHFVRTWHVDFEIFTSLN